MGQAVKVFDLPRMGAFGLIDKLSELLSKAEDELTTEIRDLPIESLIALPDHKIQPAKGSKRPPGR
jgi:hypothetical protein